MLRSLGQLLLVLGLMGVGLVFPACSDDTPASGEDDTGVIDGGGGDLTTDGLFQPPDGGETGDGAAGTDTGQDTGSSNDPLEDSGGEGLGRYEECGFGGPACEPPLQCLGTCQLPCDAGCLEGEDCIDLGLGGVCGHIVGEGEACSLNEARLCDEGLDCGDDGLCHAEEVAGEGEACNTFGTGCEEGLVCVAGGFNGDGTCRPVCEETHDCDEGEVCVGSIVGGSACFEDCDPDTDPECTDETTVCRAPIGGGDPACLPRTGNEPGTQAFGQPCDNEDNRCQEGLFCPGLQGSYCTQTCGEDGDCPDEPAGATCLGFGIGGGVCVFGCPGGDTDCPEGMSCTDLLGQAVCTY
jgi:hypothetical protein